MLELIIVRCILDIMECMKPNPDTIITSHRDTIVWHIVRDENSATFQ